MRGLDASGFRARKAVAPQRAKRPSAPVAISSYQVTDREKAQECATDGSDILCEPLVTRRQDRKRPGQIPGRFCVMGRKPV